MPQKFIKLTNPNNERIFISVPNMSAIAEAPNGSKVFVVGDNEPFLVKETPIEVLARLEG
jgi:hypothetical protein